MTTATMQGDRSSGMWEVTTRVIVYAAIGAALYGVAAVFSFLIPGTANVSVRPAFALVTFFGFAFGPIVGFFTGFVGNAIADQISGWGLLTSWNWSLANGLAGLLAGGRQEYGMAAAGQCLLERAAYRRLVIDHQDRIGLHDTRARCRVERAGEK